MEIFKIRYHTVGGQTITDIKEFESFGVAVARVGKVIESNPVIAVVKNEGHIIEIKTAHITHHEILTKEAAVKSR